MKTQNNDAVLAGGCTVHLEHTKDIQFVLSEKMAQTEMSTIGNAHYRGEVIATQASAQADSNQ